MSGGQFNNIDYISFKIKTAANDSATAITASAVAGTTAAISASTVADPSVWTSAAHSLTTGQTVTLASNDSGDVADGTYEVVVLSATTFYLVLNGVPVAETTSGATTGTIAATYTVITAAGHGLTDDQSVTIANESTATPALNGVHVANVLTNDLFEIPVVVSSAGTDGDVSAEFGTTSQPQHICYYCAPCLDITGITLATPGVITTSEPHNLVTGDRIYLTGTDSTPTINGPRVVTVLSSTTFNVGVDTTGAGTTGQICIEKYGVKEIKIDSYDGNGDPVYLGETLVNQRLNVAESRFEYILVEDSAVSATTEKVHMIGYSDNVSKTTYSFLNPIETAWDWSAAADQVTAISTSTDDDTGGIGALTLEVVGLTTGHVEAAAESITMDGTTETVAAGSDFLRVNNIRVATTGSNSDSGLSNSGVITIAKDTGEHVGTIPIGMGVAPLGMYTVPVGKTWCLSSINVYAEQKREFEIRVMVREFSGDTTSTLGPYMIHQTFSMGTQALISGKETEIDIPAQSDVWVVATQKSGQAGGEVAVHLIGKLMTN
jgi:hypothetical protein